MKFTLPLSIKIVRFDLNDNSEVQVAEKQFEELYAAGYSIIQSGSTLPRVSVAPRPYKETTIVWFVMSTRKDL